MGNMRTDRSVLGAELEAHRPYLLRIARQQMRNDTWAEDAVSETLLAALEKSASFAGRSQLRTWLVSILRNKVIDQFRRARREVALGDSGDEDKAAGEVGHFLSDAADSSREPPSPWPEPADALAERQFIHAVDHCVEGLPDRLGRVFLMREWLELEAEEICGELGIGASNLWVMLHRARLRLRECMQAHWVRR
jgi:RNA polymerase sigma-70 factor (TIGR02943 family)